MEEEKSPEYYRNAYAKFKQGVEEKMTAVEREMRDNLEKDLYSGGGPVMPPLNLPDDPWRIRLAMWWYRQRMKLAELIVGHEIEEEYNEDWD